MNYHAREHFSQQTWPNKIKTEENVMTTVEEVEEATVIEMEVIEKVAPGEDEAAEVDMATEMEIVKVAPEVEEVDSVADVVVAMERIEREDHTNLERTLTLSLETQTEKY